MPKAEAHSVGVPCVSASHDFLGIFSPHGGSHKEEVERLGVLRGHVVFLFGNKDGLVRVLFARARAHELALLDRLRLAGQPLGLVPAIEQVWAWLAADEHRPLLRLWAEAYARSLVEPDGPWAGFARATVSDWLDVLAACQPPSERDGEGWIAREGQARALP